VGSRLCRGARSGAALLLQRLENCDTGSHSHCLCEVSESGFGGPVVTMLTSGTQDRGFEPVGYLGRISPQHAFLRRGSKAVCPMSHICDM
jgi:hypothetical protein